MFLRVEPMRAAMVAVAWLFSIIILERPAPAQQQVPTPSKMSAELPWIGCWELIVEGKGDENRSSGERHSVCVEPTTDPRAVNLTGRVDDQIVVRQLLVADGTRRPAGDAACKGWKMTLRSTDGRRLYLQSDTTCVDGSRRHLSGVSMLVAADRWVDIQVLRLGTESDLAIRRYRPVGADHLHLPGSALAATHAVRMPSVTRLTANDVVEALGWVEPLVVEAMLLESETAFAIDSRVLLRLAELQVPERIIDLMVALSFPAYFTLEGQTISRTKETYYGNSWSPLYPRYGYGYFDYYYWHPPVAAPPWKGSGGKVISGRGYTQVQRNQRPSGGLVGIFTQPSGAGGGGGAGFGSSDSAGSSSSGSASSGGYSSSGSSSGPTRSAVRK